MRLTKTEEQSWESKRHFIAVAALAMRSIIVDRARARHAKKRGDGRARLDLHDDLPVFHDHSLDILEVDEALRRLEAVDARSARVVALRFYLGLSEPEIAQALGVTDRTVRRDWTFAKLWLQRALAAKHDHPADSVHSLKQGNDG